MNTEEQLKILVARIQAQPGLEEKIESILDIILDSAVQMAQMCWDLAVGAFLREFDIT